MQGGAICHTAAEIRVFFNAQFQSCVISCKAKGKWLPYSPTQPPLILLILHYDLLVRTKAVNYQWTEKTFKDMVYMIPEQMIQDPVGNINKKCNARKQGEGDHFESFFQYL